MSSDPKNYFGLLVDEISESGHSLYYKMTHLTTFRTISAQTK